MIFKEILFLDVKILEIWTGMLKNNTHIMSNINELKKKLFIQSSRLKS